MDLKAVLNTAGRAQCNETLFTLLDRFLNRAFGALPKLEVKLIILHALKSLGAISAKPQAYELISKLKVTRAKANKLIYEQTGSLTLYSVGMAK